MNRLMQLSSRSTQRFFSTQKYHVTSAAFSSRSIHSSMSYKALEQPKFQLSSLQHARQLTTGPETMDFKAETKQLLDIVTNSIYTDKEVFIRELISNASDALEKLRYNQVAGGSGSVSDLEINILTDQTNNTLSIVDNGIGMSREDLISNLGTIARSGSKEFVKGLKNTAAASGNTDGIIGQFGVGFYSSFMVADTVTVDSIAAATAQDKAEHEIAHAYRWSSDGSGVFHVEQVAAPDGMANGSKIVMHLRDSCKEFADPESIKSIIKRYSSFVNFPIKVNGEVVNTVSAIWTKDKAEVTDAQYNEFYKFVSNAFDTPKYRLHFRADAPIDLKCLFFVPTFHSEKFGMGRMEPGVNLYSRKVLIESKPKDLLPDWLRFIKGVVDSEDLPLSLSREKSQDSSLLKRIKDVLTRKLLRFFSDEMKADATKFKEFYIEYHMFFKEGVVQDYKFMDQISKLLMFETSVKGEGDLITFDDYLSRCAPEQDKIYYLIAPNREAALQSPYYETFKKYGIEVLFLYNTIDDFVMSNMGKYSGRDLVSAETSSVDLEELSNKKSENETESATNDSENKKTTATTTLTEEQGRDVCDWLARTLTNKRVKQVKLTYRLSDSPAIVTDHESGALRRMMRMVEQANAGKSSTDTLPPATLEINPSHPLIVGIHTIMADESRATTAQIVAEQLLDNSLMAAGLIEDPRYMLPRLNEILLASMNNSKTGKE